jgi:hypothetical protein
MNSNLNHHDVLSIITAVSVIWIVGAGFWQSVLIGAICAFLATTFSVREVLDEQEKSTKSTENTPE